MQNEEKKSELKELQDQNGLVELEKMQNEEENTVDKQMMDSNDPEKQSSVIIKSMTPEDAVQVHQVELSCFSTPWSLESFQDIFKYKENYYLTAWEGGRIVGFIGLMAVAGEGDITNVAVLPTYRKRGIGDQLVSSMLALAKEKNIKKIMLEVRASNEAAIHLYEKYGFEFLCIRKGYYQKPTEDANIMCWEW